MIMPFKDKLYNGRKGIGFENPSYFCKAKKLRPSLYDEHVIGLGYTPMFLTHSDEALEIEKFKRARENKIEFAYDYGNLNESYVNEKINFSDDYFQEIINPNFKKIDSPVQQTSSLKPYVPTVILEKIIITLEDEVLSLLKKERELLETIESLKSKGVESCAMQVTKLKSENEDLKLSVEELTKAREIAEATLRERDETISAPSKKLRLLEEKYEVFHEVQYESDSDVFYDTQDNSGKDLILSLQTQLKETSKLVIRFSNDKYCALKELRA
ncbi:hypothetical protein Tco_0052287 [Tanacetum coccineum]